MGDQDEHGDEPYLGGLNLPHELQMLPDDAVVRWGWVRRKLLAVEDDGVEASIRYLEWIVTRNLTFGPDGKRLTKEKKLAAAADEMEG